MFFQSETIESPFSQEHILVIVDGSEPVIENWDKEVSKLDVKDLTDGEWSMTEPDDGDYGSIVLEPGPDMITDDLLEDNQCKHRFRKKF
jgi:hypothetical protein